MKIDFKLYASLTDYLPDRGRDGRHVLELEVPPGTSVAEVIERYQLPPKLVHLVLVNGVYVAPADRASRLLAEGDALAIWPPIAGG